MPLHEHPIAHHLCSAVLAETQETILRALRDLRSPAAAHLDLLDVGCWDGGATTRYGALLGGTMSGIEIFPGPAQAAMRTGIDVALVDLEQGTFPWGANRFDVIIANQVFEHLKNIWLPLSEIHRVLKPGGHFIISVPNLASLHNRVLLSIGRQPTSIRTLGMHVRGYTLRELVTLVTLHDVFAVRSVLGVGFYPLSARLARPLARLWTGGSHTVVVVAQKLGDIPISPWKSYRQREIDDGAQTFYS